VACSASGGSEKCIKSLFGNCEGNWPHARCSNDNIRMNIKVQDAFLWAGFYLNI
jgi:hypothetical protein